MNGGLKKEFHLIVLEDAFQSRFVMWQSSILIKNEFKSADQKIVKTS